MTRVTIVMKSRIHHLSLHGPVFILIKILGWITSPESTLDISCLTSLECTVHDVNGDLPIQRLLDASAQSLQYLHIGDYPNFACHQKFDLRKLSHLHTLSIDLSLDSLTEWSDYESVLSLGPIFPPLHQKLAIVLQGSTASCCERDNYFLAPERNPQLDEKKQSLIDVSETFIQHMSQVHTVWSVNHTPPKVFELRPTPSAVNRALIQTSKYDAHPFGSSSAFLP
ncbi:hypothetical protein C8R45DRAFT_1096037 [Mycena sanguinolenta]|nr:hypothetical protein C8R45DRAFT_1096037 [Mycena sanguinolenta]